MSKAYSYIEEAFAAAVNYGYNRAHKYNESPDEDTIKSAIVTALENELFEVIDGLVFQLAAEKKLRILTGED